MKYNANRKYSDTKSVISGRGKRKGKLGNIYFLMFHIFYTELDLETNFQNWGLFEAFYGAFLLGYLAFLLEKTVVRMMGMHSQHEVRMEGRTSFPLQ